MVTERGLILQTGKRSPSNWRTSVRGIAIPLLITKLLKEIPGLRVNDPKGAFYTFVECSHYVGKHFEGKNIETATDLAMYLLEQGHVACVGGDAFGAPGHIRFSYATSDENIEKAVFGGVHHHVAGLAIQQYVGGHDLLRAELSKPGWQAQKEHEKVWLALPPEKIFLLRA